MADPSTSAKPEDHHPGERPQPPFTSVWCPEQGIYSTTLPSGLGWTNSKRKQKYCPPTLGKTPNSQISSIRIYGFSPKTTKVCSMDQRHIALFLLVCKNMYRNWEQIFRNVYSNLISVKYFNLTLQKCQSAKNWKFKKWVRHHRFTMDRFKNTALPQISKGKSHFTSGFKKIITWHFLFLSIECFSVCLCIEWLQEGRLKMQLEIQLISQAYWSVLLSPCET